LALIAFTILTGARGAIASLSSDTSTSSKAALATEEADRKEKKFDVLIHLMGVRWPVVLENDPSPEAQERRAADAA
jgi:hypothetical protein